MDEGGIKLKFYETTGDDEPSHAILVHVFRPEESEVKRSHMREELRNLAHNVGVLIVGEMEQTLSEEHARTKIGKGKLTELAHVAATASATLILFSVELSGSQLRNIEDSCSIRVMDRTQLILDIFAHRAKSFEGKAQVRLAEFSYMLPRLTGQGIALSRLGGGIGTRGPGETKLQVDRRTIRREMTKLRRIVSQAGERRSELRRRRQRQGVYTIGLVGYTNAGKTTLLSYLAKRFGEKRLQEGQNRLFDTLDPASRRIMYAGRTFVVTDTVGFIRDLPHHLINAFRATLEEATDADVLIHVIDSSSPFKMEEMETVYEVVHGLLHTKAPLISVFNKMDVIGPHQHDVFNDVTADQVIRGSVLQQETLAEILDTVDKIIGKRIALHLRIPSHRSDILADAYQLGEVNQLREESDHLLVDVHVDEREMRHFSGFVMQDGSLLEDKW